MFLQAVEDAFIAVGLFDLLDQVRDIDYDPLFVAAGGAAVFAKRWQGETWNCAEYKSCELERGEDVEE